MSQIIKGNSVMKENNKRKVYVLLTRFPDNGAKVIQALTGSFYSHASIGLEEDMNTFYSFVVKGFIVEDITRYIKPDREPFPCQLYELEVSEKVYRAVKRIIQFYVRRKQELSYTKLGVVLSLLRIPFKRKNKYICSQFVAEVLKRAKAAKLKKFTVLYLPGDFKKLSEMKLVFEGNLQSFITHFRIQPKPCLA
ncbi:MAG: hypothetical protein IJ419_04100 [Agathobacter sp.]|nr:hypothetical protein [Agathobacter sp.]